MSLDFSSKLQQAIYDLLINDFAVHTLANGHIYDVVPSSETPDVLIVLGDELVRDRSTFTTYASSHDIQIRVLSQSGGFLAAKDLADAVQSAMNIAQIQISGANVAAIRFIGSRAQRAVGPYKRQITMTFRVLVEASNS